MTPGLYPTEGEVARIVAAEKRIAANIVWYRDLRQDPNWAKFNAPVENAGGWDLTLYGRARLASPYKRSYSPGAVPRGNARGASPYKRSYSLSWTLGDTSHRIFSLDVNDTHSNYTINTEKWRQRTHKQIWKDAEHKFAYTPAETIPEEPNAAFLECNIIFSGQLGSFPPS